MNFIALFQENSKKRVCLMKELKNILTLRFVEFDFSQFVSNVIIATIFVAMVLALQYMTYMS